MVFAAQEPGAKTPSSSDMVVSSRQRGCLAQDEQSDYYWDHVRQYLAKDQLSPVSDECRLYDLRMGSNPMAERRHDSTTEYTFVKMTRAVAYLREGGLVSVSVHLASWNV